MNDENIIEVLESLSKSVKDIIAIIEDLTERVNELEK